MLTGEQIQNYDRHGFLVVKQILSPEECEELKSAVHRLIDQWEPETDYSWMLSETGKDGKSNSQFLMDSSDQVSFFIEKDAVDHDTGKLNRDKQLSVSSIGHTLHKSVPEFEKLAFSNKIKSIAQDLNFIKPAVRQTLYIFKQPFIGEAVKIHRDSSYVFNDPHKVVGIWIALEDATVENGCLWVTPGSHTEPNPRRFGRNTNKTEFDQGKKLIWTGTEEQFDNNALVPVEVKAGDAVLIHGNIIHKSEQNKSPLTRQIIAIHLLEMNNATYSKENWLQTETPFSLLYGE